MHQNGWLFPYQSSCYNNIIYHVMNTEKSQYRRTMSRNVASLNTFVPNAPFLYPLKTIESLMVFWCFQGMAKGCIGNELVRRDEFITLWILNRQKFFECCNSDAAWKVSKYGVFSGPHFPVFRLNTEIYGNVQSEYRKMCTRKSSVCGHFSRNVTSKQCKHK